MSPRQKARADNSWFDEKEADEKEVDVGKLDLRGGLETEDDRQVNIGKLSLPNHTRPDI